MPKLAAALVACLALCVPASHLLQVTEEPETQLESDVFVGLYRRGLHGSLVEITNDNDGYSMSDTSGKGYHFVLIKDGVLQDEDAILGTLTLGDLKFTDSPDEHIIVLKAKFCYEHFLLFKQPEIQNERNSMIHSSSGVGNQTLPAENTTDK